MRWSLLLVLPALLLVAACSSTPIDVQLAEQNLENIETTNEGTVELMDLLDAAKAENPDAEWTSLWSGPMRDSHELQMAANKQLAETILKRSREANE
jgi:hypothetical protein